MRVHLRLQQRARGIALRHFQHDGLEEAFRKEQGRFVTRDEVSAQAEKVMGVYMCYDCREPYCGGRVDCAEQQDLEVENLCCRECEWMKVAEVEDRRCMEHGHQFAVFKCDSCCSPAVWNCFGHHYCERCHNDPYNDKYYPCPGPGLCPLGIPHPPNV